MINKESFSLVQLLIVEKRSIRMKNELINDTVLASLSAVKSFVSMKDSNLDRYRANILVCANGKDLPAVVRIIFVKIDDNYTEIIIDGFDTIYRDRSNVFNINDSLFSFINNTLQIKSKDIFGIPIIVEISLIG